MATVTITLGGVCSGGGHAVVSMVVNGTTRGEYHIPMDDMLAPITDDQVESAIKVLVRLHAIGKSRAALRTSLQAGAEMVI